MVSLPLSLVNVIITRVVIRPINVFDLLPQCHLVLSIYVPTHCHSLSLILQLDLTHIHRQVETISFVALGERFSLTHSLLTFYHKPLVSLACTITSSISLTTFIAS